MSAILNARRGFLRMLRGGNGHELPQAYKQRSLPQAYKQRSLPQAYKRRSRDWRGAEPIEMRERRYGYFPQTFIWRGCRYDVYAVERCWTVSRRGRSGRVERHCFRVRCSFHKPTNSAAFRKPANSAALRKPANSAALGPVQDRREGTFEVYQDVQHNTWHLRQRVA